MKGFRIRAVALALATTLAGAASVATTGAQAHAIAGKAGHGCPYGAFCIYPKQWTWKTGPEKHGGVFYRYGAHNIHGQYGWHLIYNNQYRDGGYNAGANLCLGRDGKGGEDGGPLTHGHWAAMAYLTPVNSVTLFKYDLSSWHWYNLAFCRG